MDQIHLSKGDGTFISRRSLTEVIEVILEVINRDFDDRTKCDGHKIATVVALYQSQVCYSYNMSKKPMLMK